MMDKNDRFSSTGCLSVGDFVTVHGTIDFPDIDRYGIPFEEIAKVEQVLGNDRIVANGKEYQISDVGPVELTVNMLEDNGFKFSVTNMSYLLLVDLEHEMNVIVDDEYITGIACREIICWKSKNDPEYRISRKWKRYSQIRISSSYVHDLQHAMRMTGMTELADSFKINSK